MALFAGKLMTGDQLIGQIVTAELSFQVLANVLGSLGRYRVKDQALLAQLDSLIARASELEAKRNTYVHSVWGDNLGAGGRRRLKITAKRRKGLDWQVEDVPVSTLNGVADQLERLADEFDNFLGRVPEF
jgi:hypothetical protein